MSIMQRIKEQRQAGFTLLEVLLVVAIIAILAGIVIIAINPGKNLGDSRNSQRSADVNTILNGVYQYALDNNGAVPGNIGATALEICTTGTLPATCTGATPALVDLSLLTTAGKYLVQIPRDPQCPTGCATNGTGYTIKQDATTKRITVTAPSAEQGKQIEVVK